MVGAARGLLRACLDLLDGLSHQIDHRFADVLVGLRDALDVEILPYFPEHVIVAGLLEVGHHNLLRVGVGGRSGQPHLLRGPQAEQLVAPGIRLEAELFIVREFFLEAFFTLVERRHVVPVAFSSIILSENRCLRIGTMLWITEPASSYGLCALYTTGRGGQAHPLAQNLSVAREKKSAYVDCTAQLD